MLNIIADGNADLAKAIGLVKDATAVGLGIRSKRYALYMEDMTVKFIAVDETGMCFKGSGRSNHRHLC